MDPKRLRWLDGIAARVPRLLAEIRAGHAEASYVLGERDIDGRRVRLVLRAEVTEGVPKDDDGEALPELVGLPVRRMGKP